MFLSCVEEAVAVFSDSASSTEQRAAALQALAAALNFAAPETVLPKILAILRGAGSNNNEAERAAAAAVALCVLQSSSVDFIGTAEGYWLPGLLLEAVELVAVPQHVLLAAVQHAIAACEQQQHSVSVDVTLRAMAILVQQTALPGAAAWRAAHCAAALLLKHSSDSVAHSAAHAVMTALGRRSDFWHSLGNSASGVQCLVAINTAFGSSSSSSSKIQELTVADAGTDSATSGDSESAGLQALLDFIQQCEAVSSSNSYATDAVLAEWTSTATALTTLQVKIKFIRKNLGTFHRLLQALACCMVVIELCYSSSLVVRYTSYAAHCWYVRLQLLTQL
jgi:hypothetical protein